ncbi:MAG TPA: polyprenyl synthetase family protein [Polyangia bacterium]|jgi:geranylgeranyl diphosphate synthase type II
MRALEDRLGAVRALVAPRLQAALADREPRAHLYDLIARALERAGKGLRPSLCIATTRAFGGDEAHAVPSAAALEMLHNAFLVHDDIEDGSERRRDQPAMYVEHGVPLAVNVGDAMQALSLRMLKDNVKVVGPEVAWRIVDEFDHMLMQSLEGQAMELGWVRDNDCSITDDDYLLLVLKKTCWYSFIHPCRIGALIARGPGYDLGRFDRFGFLLGAAFQIQDDVLNLIGDGKKYGKEIGGDLWEGKRTLILSHLFRQVTGTDAARLRDVFAKPRDRRLPREIGWLYELLAQHRSIDFARDAAARLASAALQEMETAYADAPEGEDKDFIRNLVRYTVERSV